MALPRPNSQYSQDNEANTRQAIDIALSQKQDRQQDYTIADPVRLIIQDSVTGAYGVVTVTGGVLTWTAI